MAAPYQRSRRGAGAAPLAKMMPKTNDELGLSARQACTLIGTKNMWPLLMTKAWDDDGDFRRVSCCTVGLRYVPNAEEY